MFIFILEHKSTLNYQLITNTRITTKFIDVHVYSKLICYRYLKSGKKQFIMTRAGLGNQEHWDS